MVHDDIPDLRLGDHVQHRGHLIRDQESCLWRQGPQNAEPLQLAAGKLRWPAVHPFFLDPHTADQLLRRIPCLPEELFHFPFRIDGLFRMLKDQLHRIIALWLSFLSIQRHRSRLRGQVPGQDLPERGFPMSAGGRETDHLAGPRLKIDMGKDGMAFPVRKADIPGFNQHDHTLPFLRARSGFPALPRGSFHDGPDSGHSTGTPPADFPEAAGRRMSG